MPPDPCRKCRRERTVAEAVAYGTVCEDCTMENYPASNERLIKQHMGRCSKDADREREGRSARKNCEVPYR